MFRRRHGFNVVLTRDVTSSVRGRRRKNSSRLPQVGREEKGRGGEEALRSRSNIHVQRNHRPNSSVSLAALCFETFRKRRGKKKRTKSPAPTLLRKPSDRFSETFESNIFT